MDNERVITIPVKLAIAVPAGSDEQDTAAFVADAINETLRGHQRAWDLDSCILDYEICIDRVRPNAADPANYEEGDAFGRP